MAAAATVPQFEFWKFCPYLNCGEPTDVNTGSRFCGQCGAVFNICPACRATNRLLAEFCRGCGQHLESEVWPMQTGLRAERMARQSIQTLGTPFSVHLNAAVAVGPVVVDGLIMVAEMNGVIVLLSETNCQQLGRLNVGGEIVVSPATKSGALFVATGATVRAFDLIGFMDQPALEEAKPVWSFRCDDEAITQPLVVDENAIYILSSSGGRAALDAVSQTEGTRIWSEPRRFETNQLFPPMLVNDLLLVVTFMGDVSVLDPMTGEVRHSFKLKRRVDHQVLPFVVNQRVVFADPEGFIFEIVIDRSGPLVNDLHDNRARISSLAASNQYIAIGHLAGLTLLSAHGNLLWSSDTLESITLPPVIMGESIFALDDTGTGLLFNPLKANPVARVKLFSRETSNAPVVTKTHIVAIGEEGRVVIL